MTNFRIFDGNHNEFDTRSTKLASNEYDVGTHITFLEWCGQLTRPLPVLV